MSLVSDLIKRIAPRVEPAFARPTLLRTVSGFLPITSRVVRSSIYKSLSWFGEL
jgi:hypothetical protein